MLIKKITLAIGLVLLAGATTALADSDKSKPNVLVIWGDDIGYFNISAYNRGMMGYRTPHIDRIANEGAVFTHFYGQQSCTAGRAAFVLGEDPFRTGLLTVGMPGSEHGIPDWAPTIADVLKEQGYVTAQYGKNHLGDRDQHLPTKHGFDQFFGNLYHLNAEEEPETYYYPKDPEFRKKYAPRGVIKSSADGKIEDTGPLSRKRMETVDGEFLDKALNFIDSAQQQEKPFFVWYNASRMHVWTRLQPKYDGITGIGVYPDGMVEHDDQVGVLLKKLDDLKIADNTIVIYSTDNGAEKFSWPDGGTSPFHGEKGTTFEGGMRVPQLVRWPGVIKPGAEIDALMSQEDWLPTLAAAAGDDKVVEKMAKGANYNNKQWRVHLDGYNFMPYLKGQANESPRDTKIYWTANGELNAIRWKDWKANFAVSKGDITSATREIPQWAMLTNLKADPFETAPFESKMYTRWMADNMWLFVPMSEAVAKYMATFQQGYPFQQGTNFSAANINYNSLKLQQVLKQLEAHPQ